MLPHLKAAHSLACDLTRDSTAAEEIVQDAFLRAFGAFPSYRGGEPRAWLFAIVRNCFFTEKRARRRATAVLIAECELSQAQTLARDNVADDTLETPEAELIRRHEVDRLRAAVASLPEPFRATLILRELEELSYKEIAILTGIPIGTVMSRLARSRKMLSEMLAPGLGSGRPAPPRNPAIRAGSDGASRLQGAVDNDIDAVNAAPRPHAPCRRPRWA
jgi:RNA polymerase sigma factor (sigma-70 family)